MGIDAAAAPAIEATGAAETPAMELADEATEARTGIGTGTAAGDDAADGAVIRAALGT